jgi:lysophospholipase L1-like esterase
MQSPTQLISTLGSKAKLAMWPTINTRVRPRSWATVAATILAVAGIAFMPAAAAKDRHGHDEDRWVGTWSASPQAAGTPFTGTPVQINAQTVREIVHTSIGGDSVRVRLSNAYGTGSLVIGSAHLAVRSEGASIEPGSDRVLMFNGSPTIAIPAGALVVSDPVTLTVPELGDLAVSIFIPGNVAATTEHSQGLQTTYISPPGDFSGAASMEAATTTQSWYFLAGVEVKASKKTRAIVTLGDSITDGFGSTPDTNGRWPNRLAERLQARPGKFRLAVLDQGIGGNRILHDFIGTNALARLDRDVLAQTGARYVIVLEGLNDIGIPGAFGLAAEQVTAEQIIAGHRQIIDRAHALGLKIFGGTLTPFEGATLPGFFSAAGEVKRQAVNEWIRTSKAYDAVIDFDAVTRDPAHPTRLLPAYDSGDHLHPNDTGYKAMADAVDLSLFSDDDD